MFEINRRDALTAIAGTFAGVVKAQNFPVRPIKIIVGFTVGATATLARLYADRLAENLSTPVIVEPKPGAGQILAIRTLLMAPADGYTLYMGTGSAFAQGPGVRNDLPYTPAKDFAFVNQIATTAGAIVVHPEVPAHNMRELIAYAQSNPGKLNYGSAGHGTANHLQTELLQSRIGVKLTHIPYKNDADMIMALTQGDVHLAITTVQTVVPLVSTSKVRALCVTSSKRVAAIPDVPHLNETGVKGLDALDPYSFFGLVAPRGLPPDTLALLNGSINKITSTPDVAQKIRDNVYSEPVMGSSEDFRRVVELETTKWAAVGKSINFKS